MAVRDSAVYDAETGTTAVANHIVYDAYGRVTSETNAAVDCLFAFTGRALDTATGLQNNWNRWYDAEVGRWMSEDPIGFEGRDANISCYVGNSPTNGADPSGLATNVAAIVAVDATNSWTWKEFLDALAKAKPGDVVRYYGHTVGEDHKRLQFGKHWYNNYGEAHTREEIAKNWGKASVFVIQSCGSAKIAKYLAKNTNGEIRAAIGTNIDIQDYHARQLVAWFLDALRQKNMTVQEAVNYANKKMKDNWKTGTRTGIDVAQLSCYGPDIRLTLEQIRKNANKRN